MNSTGFQSVPLGPRRFPRMTVLPTACVELAQKDQVKSFVSVICGIAVFPALAYWLEPLNCSTCPRVASLTQVGELNSVAAVPPGAKFAAVVPEVWLRGQ